MTEYNAGKARATWEIDFSPARQELAAFRREVVDLQRFIAQVQRAQRAQPAVRPTGGAGSNAQAARDAAQLARAEAQAATAVARRQREEAQLAATLAQAATADQRRQTEAARTAAAEDRAATAALRRQQAEERAARQGQNGGLGPALPRTFAGFTPGGLAQAAGAFGLATIGPAVVGQAIGAGVGAGQQALQLQQTIRLTRELSGTQAQYNQVLAAAREQQERYGGTLQENIQGLGGLVITARSSGAELQQLIGLSQRLALLDPTQGAEGARIALSEALSGDPRSLALRYEIPRSALERLKDESLSASERLGVLDEYLNKIGITAGVVDSAVSEQTRAFNRLGAEVDTLTTNVGGGLANAFDDAAVGLGRLIGLINSNPDAIAELRALATGETTTLVRTGDAEEGQRQIAAAIQARTIATQNSAQADAAGYAAASQYAAGIREAVEAARGSVEANNAAAVASLTHATQTEIAKVRQEELERALQAAAAGSETEAAAAARLAQVYAGTTIPELVALISLLREKAALEGGGQGAIDAGLRGFARGARQQAQEREQAAALAAAQRRYTEATETSTARVARLRGELGRLTPGTAAYVDKQTELAQALRAVSAEQQRASTAAARAGTRDANAAARDATALARAREQEYQAARDTAQKIEDLRRDHFEKLRRMEEDYLLSTSRDREDFEIEKQRLLAEGQIKEAQLLEERFNREQRRAAEDRAVAVRREREQAAQAVAEAQVQAAQDARDRAAQRAISGTPLPGDAAGRAAIAGAAAASAGAAPTAAQLAGAQAAQAAATLAATAAQRPAAFTLQVQIAPTQVQIGAEQIVTVTWPLIEQRVDAELTAGLLNVAVTAPPGAGQGSGVGGPTP